MPSDHEYRREHRAERATKGGRAEQAQVEERLRENLLAPHERRPCSEAEEERRAGGGVEAAAGDFLQAVDEPEQAEQRERGAGQVKLRRGGIALLGEQARSENEQQKHHRHGDEEDRAPPEVFEQGAADERPDRRAEAEARDPHPDREGPLPLVGEHSAKEREGGGCERRPRDAEQRPRDYEHRRAR